MSETVYITRSRRIIRFRYDFGSHRFLVDFECKNDFDVFCRVTRIPSL